MDTQNPKTDQGRQLHDRLSAARWQRVVADAVTRAEVVDAVLKHHADTQAPWRQCVAAVGAHWSNWRRWKKRYDDGVGETWERLLDERVPPSGKICEQIRCSSSLASALQPLDELR